MSNENGGLKGPATTPKATSSPGSFSATCIRHNVVVEFRPLATYRGEYGFDWLRVFEGPDDEKNYANELPYIDAANIARGMSTTPSLAAGINFTNRVGSICGGAARSSASATSALPSALPPDLTAAQAKAAIASEYESLPVTRHPTPTYRLPKNYVSYLNLFPEGTPLPWQHRLDPVRSANPESGYGLDPMLPNHVNDLPGPLCEATLRVLFDIKDQAPTKIGLRYNGKFLEITGTGTTENGTGTMKEYFFHPASFQTITGDQYTDSVQTLASITIKCIKATSSNLDIIAYAYDCNGIADSAPCGKLVFLANDPVKKMKIALVSVETNLKAVSGTGGIKIGTFNIPQEGPGTGCPDELASLYKTLYQALILPDVINTYLESGEINWITLDLTRDSAFLPSNTKNFIVPVGKEDAKEEEKIPCIDAADEKGFSRYIEGRLDERYPGMVRNYWTVFCFGEYGKPAQSGRASADMVTDNSVKPPNITVIKSRSSISMFLYRDSLTLPHELLHTLDLCHTHDDLTYRLQKTQKYIFEVGHTSNIMAYIPYNPRISRADQYCTTWYWQWEIMQQGVKKGPVR